MPKTKPSSESKNPVLFAFLIGSFLGIFIALTFSIFLVIQYKSQNYLKVAKGIPKLTVDDRQAITDQNLTEYFVSDIQPNYPQFTQMIGSKKIIEARSLNVGFEGPTIWVVQVENTETDDFYLVYKDLQKKLDRVMSVSGYDVKCTLDDLKLIKGTDYGRTLKDEQGYLVFAGSDCRTYGGGEFVAVYEISTGNKVSFSADFDIPYTQGKPGVNNAGNAQGVLRGVYGTEKPVVVVDYGNQDAAPDELESVDLTAIFDLPTGKLKQLIRY
jgi:hypothetical protein